MTWRIIARRSRIVREKDYRRRQDVHVCQRHTVIEPDMDNGLAWALFTAGCPEDGLPYTRAAVAGLPDNFGCLDTLGHIPVATGDASKAEMHLRLALALQNRPSTRVVLAQALAAQGRCPEAVAEASGRSPNRKAQTQA